MTTVDEVDSDKTKVPDEFIVVVFCLLVLRPNSMGKLVKNRCKFTCKRLIKTIRLYTCMQTSNWVPVFICQSVILCCSALKLY